MAIREHNVPAAPAAGAEDERIVEPFVDLPKLFRFRPKLKLLLPNIFLPRILMGIVDPSCFICGEERLISGMLPIWLLIGAVMGLVCK
mmetsp:Transcript_8127/g.9801  ORF Transcript_8127/g.9801 Transcript_8127/m.9801 type:complete len:88 (-) Transcript_8127:550-813(-)